MGTNGPAEYILYRVQTYYSLCIYLEQMLERVKNRDDITSRCHYVCYSGFIKSLKSYLFSVYDDLLYLNPNNFMPKSNANRILLRNCLESNLILNILDNSPELAEKYFDTLKSDIDRIKETYGIASPNDDKEDETESKKYMKRFSWLPRYKGRKASAMKDLLNYIPFDDEEQLTFYNILIRNFDTFVHPSFNFGYTIEAGKNGQTNDLLNISMLFIDEGLVPQCCAITVSNFEDTYKETFSKKEYMLLELLVDHKPNIPLPLVSIGADYEKRAKKTPEFIHMIPFSITSLANNIQNTSYYCKNISYLLYDLGAHYDDMLMSKYSNDTLMFYAQSRYVIESLSIINILLQEDEERSKIYYIHQSIKGYDAKITALDFLNKYRVRGTQDTTQVSNTQNENIEIIRNYYREKFNQEIDNGKILRLNGWALYLKKQQNDGVPNSPFFVDALARDCFVENVDEIAHYLLGFFEESNAFTHITPYAFDVMQDKFDLNYPLLLINQILEKVALNIISSLNLRKAIPLNVMDDIDAGLVTCVAQLSDNIKNEKSFN